MNACFERGWQAVETGRGGFGLSHQVTSPQCSMFPILLRLRTVIDGVSGRTTSVSAPSQNIVLYFSRTPADVSNLLKILAGI